MATDQVLCLSAPADHVRSDRPTRRFDAQEIIPGASTSMALRRLLGARNRSQRPLKFCFPGPR
jgi:hypothetical protein